MTLYETVLLDHLKSARDSLYEAGKVADAHSHDVDRGFLDAIQRLVGLAIEEVCS